MSEEHYDMIVGRVRAVLAPSWDPGTVGINEPLSWIGPSLLAGAHPDDFLTLSWDISDDVNVARGAGAVLMVGEIFGHDLFDEGSLDEMLTKVEQEWRKRKDKKRGWFSR